MRGLAALWAVTLADLAASLPREHLVRAHRPRRGIRRRYQFVAASALPPNQMMRLMNRTARTPMRLLKWLWQLLFGPWFGPPRRRAPRSQPRPHPSDLPDQGRFDKFTERAKKVMTLAQQEALRFNHNYLGTEHLLLGLVREGDGVAAQVLRNLGVDLLRVRQAVEFIIGRGDRMVLGEIGLTPRAKKVVELAVDEARRMGHHYIGTEHLLLGMVREGEGIAAGVLQSLNVRLERVRAETLRVLGEVDQGRGNEGDQPGDQPDAPPPDPPVV
jgi:hypothetical protein